MAKTKHETLAAALSAAQAQIEHVAKDQTFKAGNFSYQYAGSEDIIDEARRALSDNGLAFFAESALYEPGSAETRSPAIVTVRYVLAHEGGTQYSVVSQTPVIPGPGRPDDKAIAAAKTYDLGYTLRSLLLIPRGDGEHAVDQRRDDAPPPTPPKPAPKKDAKPGLSDAERASIVAAQAQVSAAIEDAQRRGNATADVQAECKRFHAANGGRAKVIASSELMGQLVGLLDDMKPASADEEVPWNSKK